MFFIGVVEDRVDPKNLGRVRVRIFGDHTEDKSKIPTDSLPWSHVMMPSTSASVGGVGQSPTGISQGSWVIGTYLDGEDKQQPFVLGTIHGTPAAPNTQTGFGDPAGLNPVRNIGIDTPYAASEDTYFEHAAYISRADTRVENVEEGIPPRVTSVATDESDDYYETPTWSSPPVNGGNPPVYPFNRVNETESGHVFEIDDTPGNERITEYHRAGTNYEIQADGTKTTTVVGDNYTVVFGKDHIYIKGNATMTVDGDFRQLVKGNYHLEVNGKKTELVRGSRQTKIGQSDNIEIVQEFASNVNTNYIQRVGGAETRVVDLQRSTTIGADDDLMVSGNYGMIVLGTTNMFSSQPLAVTTTGTLKVTSQEDITIETPSSMVENVEGSVTHNIGVDVTTNAGGNLTDNVTGNVDVNATRIDLN